MNLDKPSNINSIINSTSYILSKFNKTDNHFKDLLPLFLKKWVEKDRKTEDMDMTGHTIGDRCTPINLS